MEICMRLFNFAQVFCFSFVLLSLSNSASALKPGGPTNVLSKGVLKKMDGEMTTMNTVRSSFTGDSLVVYGTYAADFNAIEYAQRLKFYLPELEAKGIENYYLILNAGVDSCKELAQLVDLPAKVCVLSDEMGEAGSAFGVSKGWNAQDKEMNPYLKLFAMFFGLGGLMTLPSVLGGYLGNPFDAQPWIEDALAVGTRKNRFPTNALEMTSDGKVIKNKFADLPYVGSWKRRPLELATLRLQNMVGVSLKNWSSLKPSDEALKAGVLTQLGGLAVYSFDGEVKYKHVDDGICDVCKFENILENL